jgi:hypothetical protein
MRLHQSAGHTEVVLGPLLSCVIQTFKAKRDIKEVATTTVALDGHELSRSSWAAIEASRAAAGGLAASDEAFMAFHARFAPFFYRQLALAQRLLGGRAAGLSAAVYPLS